MRKCAGLTKEGSVVRIFFILMASLLFAQEPDSVNLILVDRFDKPKKRQDFIIDQPEQKESLLDRLNRFQVEPSDSMYRIRTEHKIDIPMLESIGGEFKHYNYQIMTIWVDSYSIMPMNNSFIGNSLKYKFEDGYTRALVVQYKKGVIYGERNKSKEKWEAFGYGSATATALGLLLLLIL